VFVIVFFHLFVHHNVNSICNVRLYLLIENLVLQRCELGYMYCFEKIGCPILFSTSTLSNLRSDSCKLLVNLDGLQNLNSLLKSI
jgi:hypothetical protein